MGSFSWLATYPVTLKALTIHHLGSTNINDISKVYLYIDGRPLTTRLTIDQTNQTITFNDLNLSVFIGKITKLCVVGDILTTATSGDQHSFEIENYGAITTNAAAIEASFPLQGNLMTIN